MGLQFERLNYYNIHDLVDFCKQCEGCPDITEEQANLYCHVLEPELPSVRTYGAFDGNQLVGILTAEFFLVFPGKAVPSGRCTAVMGLYSLPKYSLGEISAGILKLVKKDSEAFGADGVFSYGLSGKVDFQSDDSFGFKTLAEL